MGKSRATVIFQVSSIHHETAVPLQIIYSAECFAVKVSAQPTDKELVRIS